MMLPRFARAITTVLPTAGLLLVAQPTLAVDKTFTLDRLLVASGPVDGVALWRPDITNEVTIFGQLQLGFQLHPFRLENSLDDQKDRSLVAFRPDGGNPVDTMTHAYVGAGVEFLRRVQLQVSLPITLFQTTNQTGFSSIDSATTVTSAQPVAAGDLRIEARAVPYFTRDKLFKLGLNAALFAPSGDSFSYAGDGATGGGLGLAAEVDAKSAQIVLNTFAHFRRNAKINDFQLEHEFRYGLGAFFPLRDGQVRLGLSVFGSASMSPIAQREANFPLEWMFEGRVTPDQERRVFLGANVGTRMTPGYAPDFRGGLSVGYKFTIVDSKPPSPPKQFQFPPPSEVDTDKDGYPDDIDLCPTVKEDKLPPNPTDGCPTDPDKDKDGIPDVRDKCPDVPEDFDKIDDADGCPEDDADADGIADATDACPKEPGVESTEKDKNGCPKFIRRVSGSNEITILQQVQFRTGSAVILPGSFVILDEVVALLKANSDIKVLAVEGHTDNRGSNELNAKLSADRAKACVDYIVSKGIDAGRLTSAGFGPTKPLVPNDSDPNRQKNRRTEFHIRETDAPAQPVAPSDGPTLGD